MQALVVQAHGGLEALEILDRETPKIKADDLLIKIEASGMNHLDVWVRKCVEGHRFPLPMILGCDGAGVVVEAGLPLPGHRSWRRELSGEVVRTHTEDGAVHSFVRLDLDEAAVDELAYYCGVTTPTLAWLGQEIVAFGPVHPVPTAAAA